MPFRSPSPSRAARPLAASLLAAALLAPTAAWAGFRVDTDLDTPDVAIGDGRCEDAAGRCSLRAAIQEGNTRKKASIRLQRDTVYTLTLAGAGEDAGATGDLDVTGILKIRGRNSTVDAGGLDRIFDIHDDGELRVKKLTLTGGVAPAGEHGGAVRNAGLFDGKRSIFEANAAPGAGGAGGALHNDRGALRVKRSTLTGNTAAEAGGAIAADGGLTVVDRSQLSGNQSGLDGGAVHQVASGELWIWKSDVLGNTAARSGGGAWTDGPSDVVVYRAVFDDNEAQGGAAADGGGGFYIDAESDVYVERSTFSANRASGVAGGGGGLRLAGGRLELVASVLEDNGAAVGGGLDVTGGRAFFWYSIAVGNSADADGGGLRVGPGGAAEVFLSGVGSNEAGAEGGGLWCSATGTLDVDDSDVDENIAPTGPDVFNEPPGGDFTIDGEPVPPG